MDVRKHIGLQKTVYAILRISGGWLLMLLTGFHNRHYRVKSRTFLMLANHNCDLDWAFPVIATRRHMRFVASANILDGFAGRIIKLLVSPIPRYKGAPADETAELVMKNLKAGVSVAIFPEGNKSWDGKTGFISERNARIVKESGAGLLTYRISGGYLRTPRWSDVTRRGPMFGEVVREYTAEELDKMTVEEITAHIREDLMTDAPAFQEKSGYLYPGKALSRGIDTVLYICPECRKVSRIRSDSDSFYCECGLKGRMNERAHLESLTERPLPFTDTVRWNEWQKKWLSENAEMLQQSSECISEDLHASLVRIDGDVRTELLTDVPVRIYGDRMTAGEQEEEVFSLQGIRRISVFRNRRLFFSSDRGYYELRFRDSVSGLKYDALWRTLTGKVYY